MHIKVTSLTLSVTVLSELGVFRKKEAQAKQFYSRKWRESLTWWLRAGVRHPRVIFLEVTLGKLSHWLELHFPPRCWWFSLHAVSSSCDPADCSLPGSSVRGILQARTLKRVAISFSRGSSQPRVSCTAGRFFTNWTTSAYTFSSVKWW